MFVLCAYSYYPFELFIGLFYHLFTENEAITGKSQTEALMALFLNGKKNTESNFQHLLAIGYLRSCSLNRNDMTMPSKLQDTETEVVYHLQKVSRQSAWKDRLYKYMPWTPTPVDNNARSLQENLACLAANQSARTIIAI